MAEYEKRDKEKGRMALAGRAEAVKQITPARPFGTKESPPEVKKREHVMMRVMGGDEEETIDQEFHKATDALCIDGGAYLHASHRQLKLWARDFNAVEPAQEARKLLKWSRTPIIFDEEDHPSRTIAVGCLPLLVSPTIGNLKVTKMLVDGGGGLNLIFPAVISKLQIG